MWITSLPKLSRIFISNWRRFPQQLRSQQPLFSAAKKIFWPTEFFMTYLLFVSNPMRTVNWNYSQYLWIFIRYCMDFESLLSRTSVCWWTRIWSIWVKYSRPGGQLLVETELGDNCSVSKYIIEFQNFQFICNSCHWITNWLRFLKYIVCNLRGSSISLRLDGNSR